MIEVHFSCCNSSLDIKTELGIDVDVGYFIMDKINGLQLVATDKQDDIDDNIFYWFSSKDEELACLQIQRLICSHIKNASQMSYNVKIISLD